MTHFIRIGEKIVSRSKNLAGVRRYGPRKHVRIERVHIAARTWPHDTAEASLRVKFADGAYFRCRFGSYTVLQGWVRNWRWAWGARLFVDGIENGQVDLANPVLRPGGWQPPPRRR